MESGYKTFESSDKASPQRTGKAASGVGDAVTRSGGDDSGGGSSSITVEEAIEQIGFGMFQVKISVLAGLAWMSDAMEIMILSILGPILLCEWNIKSWEEALLTSVVFVGFLIGSPLAGVLSDTHGRKLCLLFMTMWAMYFGLLTSVAPGFTFLLLLRLLTGFGLSALPQAVTIYSEFLPPQNRGMCLVLLECSFAVGGAVEVILALLLVDSLGWRLWLVMSALPLGAFVVIAVWWMPESPRYHVAIGNTHTAMKTLNRIAKDNKKAPLKGKLVAEIQEKRGRISDMLHKSLRRTTLLLWTNWLAAGFIYYGVILLSTEMIHGGATCTEGGLSLEGELACPLECKRLSRTEYLELMWTSFAELPALLVVALTVDKLGRKPLLAICYSVLVLVIAMLFICTGKYVMIFLLFAARGLIAGGFQIVYLYTPEFYPTSVRALGLGTGCGFSRLGAVLTPYVAQVLLKHSVRHGLAVYLVLSVLAFLVTITLPTDTKGKVMKSGLD